MGVGLSELVYSMLSYEKKAFFAVGYPIVLAGLGHFMPGGNKNNHDNHNMTFVQSLNLSIKKTADLERVPALAYLPHHHLITIMEPPWAHSALPSTCDIKST